MTHDPSKPLTILQLNSARLYVGEAAHTLNLTEALRGAGHQVLLGLRQGYTTFDAAERRGLQPHGFAMQHRWWFTHDLPDLRKLEGLVREHGVQVIHAHRGKDHWLSALAVQLKRLRVPVIRTRHVVTPLRSHMANRWLARHTPRLIVVSRAVEREVLESGVYRTTQVARIPGGIELQRYKAQGRREELRLRMGLRSNAPVAVCVARFAAVKAHRVLLQAWQHVWARRTEAVLLLVGGGALQGEAEAYARELNIEAGVRFLGHLEPERVAETLEVADVGTLASVGSEGFSRAVLEYMALGLPVAATNVGAIPDLVENGINGRLVPPHDPGALATAVLEVLDLTPQQRAAWGLAGRRRAEECHGYATWVKAHEELYRGVLARRD